MAILHNQQIKVEINYSEKHTHAHTVDLGEMEATTVTDTKCVRHKAKYASIHSKAKCLQHDLPEGEGEGEEKGKKTSCIS